MSVESPCIGICKLDPARICIGCGRHVDDIVIWPVATDDERRQIREAARRRLAARTSPGVAGDFPVD